MILLLVLARISHQALLRLQIRPNPLIFTPQRCAASLPGLKWRLEPALVPRHEPGEKSGRDRFSRSTSGGFSIFLLLLGLLLLGLPRSTNAQNVRVYASTDSVTVGDRFRLHVAADYPPGMQAVLPQFSQGDTTLGDITIIQQIGFPQQSTNPAGQTDSITYEVATFALDSARVPPITVRFIREGDTARAASEPFVIEVGSLVPEDAQDIRGLAPLATFPRPWWPWLLGAGIGLLLLAAFLFYFFRKRSTVEEAAEVEITPPVPPYAEAMTRLHELETVALDDPAAIKPFYVELSDLLRTYIARTSGAPARELTTRELTNLLTRRNGTTEAIYTDARIHRIDVILRLADLVKFADRKPSTSDSKSALNATRKTIEQLEQQQTSNVDVGAQRAAPLR